MIVPFKSNKEIYYGFSVMSDDRNVVGVKEDPDRKYCNVICNSLDLLKEVIDPVSEFMERNHFDDEMKMIPISEILQS